MINQINNEKEFIKFIEFHHQVICFVHSNWSGYSHIAHKNFQTLVEAKPNFNYVLINNESAESFIYNWLELQGNKSGSINSSVYFYHIIHGYGEVFGIKSGTLNWFENKLDNQTLTHFLDNDLSNCFK